LADANLIELCCRWLRRSDGLDHAITETGAGLTISPWCSARWQITRWAPPRAAPALAFVWHGSQDLCSAFVAAVVHVNELAARNGNALAHFHRRLAPWALRRRRFQLRLGFILGCHHPRPLALAAVAAPPLQRASSMFGPSKPTGSALPRRSQYPRPRGSTELVPDIRSGQRGGP
jgi:hypothetical protein